MRLWSRFFVVVTALTLALSLSVAPAQAAKKKKEKEKKKETKKEERHEVRHESYGKHIISGLNTSGKPGYFFSDSAETLNKGEIGGAAHLTFDTWGSQVQIPVGVSYGITDKLMVNVNTSFYTAGGASGIYYLNFGGKYGFKDVGHNKNLDIAAGLDFSVGPLSNNIYGYSAFAFDPYGVCTYTFSDGFQLNGKLGLYVQNYTIPAFPPFPAISVSSSYFQLDLGAAYPFDKDLTGIAELATNGVVGNGVGGTPLLVGIRTGHDVQFQCFGGLDLGGPVGLFLGGGVALFSK